MFILERRDVMNYVMCSYFIATNYLTLWNSILFEILTSKMAKPLWKKKEEFYYIPGHPGNLSGGS